MLRITGNVNNWKLYHYRWKFPSIITINSNHQAALKKLIFNKIQDIFLDDILQSKRDVCYNLLFWECIAMVIKNYGAEKCKIIIWYQILANLAKFAIM